MGFVSDMSCYKPLKAFRTTTGVSFVERSRHDIVGDIELPCGMCIGCRMRRASDWTLRCMHEAKMHDENCFVTFTYERMPKNHSLNHRDFQLFMKRVRKKFKRNIRYYMCGEYGPLTGRPHYHAALFGLDFRDRVPCGKSKSGEIMYESELLTKLWGLGNVTVQDLTPQSAGYVARYVLKKALGIDAKTAYDLIDPETGEILCKRAPEYARMSLRPGIGATWFAKYKEDVFRHDYVVADGAKHQTPRYYDKLFSRCEKGIRPDDIEYKRQLRAQAVAEDNTPERRAVRERVHHAKIRNKLRDSV